MRLKVLLLLFDMTNSFIDSINSIQGLLDAGCDFSYKGEFAYAYTEYNIDSFLAHKMYDYDDNQFPLFQSTYSRHSSQQSF